MDKKTALATLLENSLWISDSDKKIILQKIDSLTSEQIESLGKFLVEERNIMIQDKDQILATSQELLQIIGDSIISPTATE